MKVSLNSLTKATQKQKQNLDWIQGSSLIAPFLLEMHILFQTQKKNKRCEKVYDKLNCPFMPVPNTDFGSKLVTMQKVTLPQHSTKYSQIKTLRCFVSINCCLSTIWFLLSHSSSEKILAGMNMLSFNYRTGLLL